MRVYHYKVNYTTLLPRAILLSTALWPSHASTHDTPSWPPSSIKITESSMTGRRSDLLQAKLEHTCPIRTQKNTHRAGTPAFSQGCLSRFQRSCCDRQRIGKRHLWSRAAGDCKVTDRQTWTLPGKQQFIHITHRNMAARLICARYRKGTLFRIHCAGGAVRYRFWYTTVHAY